MTVHSSFLANGERDLRVYQEMNNGDVIDIPLELAFNRVYLLFKFFEDASETFEGLPTQNFREFRRMAVQVNRFALFSVQLRPLYTPIQVRATQRQIGGRRKLLADIFSSSPNSSSLIFDACVEFCDNNGFGPIGRNCRLVKEMYLNSFRKPNLVGTYYGQNGENASKAEAERLWLVRAKIHVNEASNEAVMAWLSNQNSPLTRWVDEGEYEEDDEV